MLIYLLQTNDERPYLFGVFANLQAATYEKNILKEANSDIKIVTKKCDKIPEFVYVVTIKYHEAGFDLKEMIELKFSEKKARGIYTQLYKSRYASLEDLKVEKVKVEV